MRPLARAYAVFVSILGLAVGLICVYRYYLTIAQAENARQEIIQFVILFFLAYLCRCMPIYIRKDLSFDMAFISNFAILLCKGPDAAAAIMFICSPLVVVLSPGPNEKLSHIFNTPFIKTAFNTANYVVSVYLGGRVYLLCGGLVGTLTLPAVLLPSLFLIITVILVNSVLLLLLFKLDTDVPFLKSLWKSAPYFLPTVLCAAPLGYFLATFLLMDGGEYLVILFALPLLLARFAFSMYIDVKQNYYVLMKTLTNTVEAKDEYTRGHSERVEKYAILIAQQMRLSTARIDELRTAALLHDVGKIGIDEKILKKACRLTDEERRIIQGHPVISVNILNNVKLSSDIFTFILHHHERYDGLGYPDGIGGAELPIEAYILAVADTYDAITSDRPYSRGRSTDTARDIILQERGAQFHPDVVDVFLEAYESGALFIPHDTVSADVTERKVQEESSAV